MAVKQYGDVLTPENTSGEPKWSRWYWPCDLFSPHPIINLSYSMAVKQYGDVLTPENTSGEPKWSRWYWPC